MSRAVRDSGIPREEIFVTSKLRSIGVSNMTPKIWNSLVPQFAVNQVEFNPFFQRKEIREIMTKDDVLDIFDFELTGAEIDALRGLDTGRGTHDPDAPGLKERLLSAYRIED